jgi:hypothetical protein
MILDQPRVRIVLGASKLEMSFTNLLLSLLTIRASLAVWFNSSEDKALTKFGENDFRGAWGPVSRKWSIACFTKLSANRFLATL